MTIGYPTKGTGQFQEVSKTREVLAGTKIVYEVTIEPSSLPAGSSVNIAGDDGRLITVRGPVISSSAKSGLKASSTVIRSPLHFTYSNERAAKQAVEAIRAYGGIATILDGKIGVTRKENYTVKEEIMAPDYSKPPQAQLSLLNTLFYSWFSGFAIYSFAGLPGATASNSGKPYSEEAGYGTCALIGAVFSIPVIIDIFRTVTHKKGRIGNYGPIEYLVHKPLKEMQ
jgi:hypothetical protein